MRAAYLAAPRPCLHCDKPILPHQGEKIHETLRRRFCSRSCAASYNNGSAVAPKKKAKPRFCAECSAPLDGDASDGTRLLCATCHDRLLYRLPHLTRDAASSAEMRWHIRHALIDRPRVCAHCGYSCHVETVHLRPVDDFPPDTPLATINDPANLVYLCPNHRWEYEHGLLLLDPVANVTSQPASGNRAPLRAPRRQPLYAVAVASR